ncbi:polyribonucleotide nucleotidyltransferase-like [Branchiostoma floridae]|uniref:Polyribonucleotide nucleotidyltransferase-like n=1 Tax=Branchiostoma floridae TaxID=7739 RepID=A0A9J7LKV0_BRAFL|nr:polyribonucleotide nucleotidyltransferase-like [Branchiostoma floridae]XP_035683575.1 polyribonucleotide nucleotidyltransferase-like [Branchiostoma floridae]
MNLKALFAWIWGVVAMLFVSAQAVPAAPAKVAPAGYFKDFFETEGNLAVERVRRDERGSEKECRGGGNSDRGGRGSVNRCRRGPSARGGGGGGGGRVRRDR